MNRQTEQRLRVTFAKGEALKYISHLDLMRLWERVLRRAGVPLAYSHGHNPRPRMFIASALPVGYIGRAEVMDVLLTARTPPLEFARRLKPQLPPGLEILSVEEVSPGLPSLASQVRFSEYRVAIESSEPAPVVRQRIAALLSAPTWPAQRERKGQVQRYDLRPLIDDLCLEDSPPGHHVLAMRLQTDQQGTARPEAVLATLGLSGHVRWIERSSLILEYLEEGSKRLEGAQEGSRRP